MGIPLGPADFTRGAAKPLDDSFIQADLTARDAIVSGIRYDGMLVYVVADQTMYQLQGGITNGDWYAAGGGGGGSAPVVDLDTGDGVLTDFTLTQDPGNEDNVAAYIDGVRQSTAEYSVSGTTLTFGFAPYNGASLMFVTGGVTVVNVPADDSVTTPKIVDGAVTSEKMAARTNALATGASLSVANAGVVADFSSVSYDTDSRITTGASWNFKANRTMRVRITSVIRFASASWTAGNIIQLQAIKNGSGNFDMDSVQVQATATQIITLRGSFEFDLVNNNEVAVYIFQNSGSAKSLTSSASSNYVLITEVR